MNASLRTAVCAAVLVVSFAVPAQAFGTAQGHPPASSIGSMARFEGRWIDLSRGWGAARTCIVRPGVATRCYRERIEPSARNGGLAPGLSCSTPLRLNNGTYQTGATAFIYTRGLWVDLSTLGFNNRTSSYTVGACPVDLANGNGGTGALYSHCLSAGCVENVMDAGWDNAISSVYLY